MANRHLADSVSNGQHISEAARGLVARLVAEGPSTLNLDDEVSRNQAAAASIGASLALLTDDERACFITLGIFAEDLDVPRDVLEMGWSETLPTTHAVERLCERLNGLSLVASYNTGTGSVRLHDVVRSFLRYQHPTIMIESNRALITSARAVVAAKGAVLSGTGWWLLPDGSYFWEHLCQHLADTKLADELADLLLDLRWAEAKLRQPTLGPLSLDADYAICDDPHVRALCRAIRQAAHLFGPVELTEPQLRHAMPENAMALGRHWMSDDSDGTCQRAAVGIFFPPLKTR